MEHTTWTGVPGPVVCVSSGDDTNCNPQDHVGSHSNPQDLVGGHIGCDGGTYVFTWYHLLSRDTSDRGVVLLL